MFEALLHLGGCGASELADAVRIKRTTAYAALERLVGIGLVSRVRAEGGYRFSALAPHQIAELIQSRALARYEQAKDLGRTLGEMVQQTREVREGTFGDFEVSALNSVESVYVLLRQALTAGSFVGVFNPEYALRGKAKAIVKDFLEVSRQRQSVIRELAVDGKALAWYRRSIMNPHHEVRRLPAHCGLTTDFIVAHDFALITNYEESRASCLQIKNAAFCQSARALFELMWRGADAKAVD